MTHESTFFDPRVRLLADDLGQARTRLQDPELTADERASLVAEATRLSAELDEASTAPIRAAIEHVRRRDGSEPKAWEIALELGVLIGRGYDEAARAARTAEQQDAFAAEGLELYHRLEEALAREPIENGGRP